MKISDQVMRFLLFNEGSDEDIDAIRKALDPFNLFVFVLHVSSIHLDFDEKLNDTLRRLDLISDEHLAFLAFVELDDDMIERLNTREYHKVVQSWMEKLSPSGSKSHEHERIVTEIAQHLDIPFESLPCIVVTNNIRAKKKRWYKTSSETIDEQLYQLGLIARDHPEIKTNWNYAGHIFEKNKHKIDLCNSSGSKLVSTEDLEEVLSNLMLKDAESEILSDDVIQKLKVTNKDASMEPQYAFYPEGPTWTITFDGKTIRGLRGKGFKYIYYLVCNKFKDYSHEDINQLDGIEVYHIGRKKSSSPKGSSQTSTKKKGMIDHKAMIYGKSAQEIKRKYKELKESLEDAKREENPIEIKMAQEEYDEFSELYYEYFYRLGRVKTFKTKRKKIRDRIAKNMKEALNEIKKYDSTHKKRIWNHFNDVLGGIYASSISYRPNPDIDWQT